jgi:hypothetical protein
VEDDHVFCRWEVKGMEQLTKEEDHVFLPLKGKRHGTRLKKKTSAFCC